MTAPPIDTKTFSTLRARAALLGFTLTRGFRADGSEVIYLLQKYGLVRQRSLQELIEMFRLDPSGQGCSQLPDGFWLRR